MQFANKPFRGFTEKRPLRGRRREPRDRLGIKADRLVASLFARYIYRVFHDYRTILSEYERIPQVI